MPRTKTTPEVQPEAEAPEAPVASLDQVLERIGRLERATEAPKGLLPPRRLADPPKARGRFGQWLDRDRIDVAEQRAAEARIAEAADEQLVRIFTSRVPYVAPKPEANYRPLSEQAKRAIAAGAEAFRAQPEPPRPRDGKDGTVAWSHREWQQEASRRLRRVLFHPAHGRLVGGVADLPTYVNADEYVYVLTGWTELDLDGVRVAKGHPTLYGVHDDG